MHALVTHRENNIKYIFQNNSNLVSYESFIYEMGKRKCYDHLRCSTANYHQGTRLWQLSLKMLFLGVVRFHVLGINLLPLKMRPCAVVPLNFTGVFTLVFLSLNYFD